MSMLGPIGANLISIFKVLTPNEIDLYSEIRTHSSVKAVAVGAENIHYDGGAGHDPYSKRQEKKPEQVENQESEPAKILPLNKEIAQALEEDPHFQALQSTKASSKRTFNTTQNELSSIGILSAFEQQQIEEEKKEKEKRKRDSATVFLINERNKLKKSRMMLAEKNALDQYQKNATVEIITKNSKISEEDLEEEQRDSASKGVLVNKKHY
jgi:hypothetical protein